ncbi:MAG: hypothetical protein ABJC36_13180 [Gemmatimonadales bacterium]
MRPATVFLAGSLLALVFGLSFLAAPGAVLPLYGISPEAPTVLLARFFGVALLHAGLAVYLLRDTRDSVVQRALGLAGVVGSAAGAIVGLMGVLAGTVNALGWSTVAIYALLLLGYATCLRPRSALS